MTPLIVAEELQKDYFNSLLKMMTKINKAVRPEQLSDLMKYSKDYSLKQVDAIIDVLKLNMHEADEDNGITFWKQVKIEINGRL